MDESMRIRIARPEDAITACDVLRRSIRDLCSPDHGNDPATIESWLANKTPENVAQWIATSHVFVAEENECVLGIAAVTSAGEVTLNYVAPEARFRGVSKALLQALEAKAADLGCPRCTLESTKTAAEFYRARGYQALESDSIRMSKILDKGR